MPSAEELLARAKSLQSEKKYQHVIDLLTDELLATYDHVDLYLEKADACDMLNKGHLTISASEKALAISPGNEEALRLKANGYYDLKKYDTALETYLTLMNVAPDSPAGYVGAGNCYQDLKQHDKAVESFKKTITIDPMYEPAYNGLGNAYKSLNQYDNAIGNYDKAIELDPEDQFPYNGLANVYRVLGQYDKALENYNKALVLDPAYPSPYNGMGNAYRYLDQPDKAIEYYSKAIDLDPKFALPYYNRATTYFNTEKYHDALNDYLKYIELTQDRPDYFTSQSRSKIEEIEKLLDIPGYNSISELVNKIKDLLRFNDNCITHYTSMTVANALILENSPLRLSEGAYLNDTSEGRELFKYLSLQIQPTKINDTIAEPFAKKPFIGSFVSEKKHDDLTLWRMYGKEAKEEAKGCAITLRKDSLLEFLKIKLSTPKDYNDMAYQIDGDLSFYRVAYKTNDDKKHFTIPSAENDEAALNDYMKELAQKVKDYVKKRTSTSDIQNLLERLNEITYLFKSAEYQYEHEIRLVIKGIGFDKHIQKTIPPRVYIELVPINPVIKSITLGPKVERSDEWASGFYYSLDKEGQYPEILISHLPFK